MKTLRMRFYGGTHISRACREARALSVKERALVRFKFNDVVLTAAPGKSVDSLVWDFFFIMERQVAAYHLTTAYRLAVEKNDRALANRREGASLMLGCLDTYLATMDQTISWWGDFIPIADHVGVEINHAALAEKLRNAGYVVNAHVGCKNPDEFGNRKVMGEYILGQILSYLEHGCAPHPQLATFCAAYLLLPPLEVA